MTGENATTDDGPAIECTLDEEAAERRREWFDEALGSELEGIEEREAGVEFSFAGTPGTLETVAAFVEAESACCSFATFEVRVEPPYELIRVTMTGPDGAGELVTDGISEALEEAP